MVRGEIEKRHYSNFATTLEVVLNFDQFAASLRWIVFFVPIHSPTLSHDQESHSGTGLSA